MLNLSQYEVVPDDALREVFERILRGASPTIGREANCFLATIGAAHLVNGLAAAGFIVIGRDERLTWLDL